MKYLLCLLLLATFVTAAAGGELAESAKASNLRFSFVKLRTGVHLRYAEQGNPQGQPILLLHGYSDSLVSYGRVLPLIDPKYRVIVLDQRGHGDSSRPATGYTFPDFTRDVVEFMKVKDLENTILVGHSMGSFVAQHVAVAAPDRISRLVLVGSATTVRNNTVKELQREVTKLADPVPEKFVREFQTGILAQPVPHQFIDEIIRESRKLPARVWRDAMNGMMASPDARLNEIKLPTLIIWGDKENVFPRSEQDALLKRISNSVLRVYTDTGHCPNWEKPEQFVSDLHEFISTDQTGSIVN